MLRLTIKKKIPLATAGTLLRPPKIPGVKLTVKLRLRPDQLAPSPVKTPAPTRPAPESSQGKHPAQRRALTPEEKSSVLWKARKFSGKHLPSLACSACSMSRTCPKYKAGYECGYNPFLNAHEIRSAEDVKNYMQMLAAEMMRQVQLRAMIETANGAPPTLETMEAMALASQNLLKLHEVMQETGTVEAEITAEGGPVGALFTGMSLTEINDETASMLSKMDSVPLAEPAKALPETSTSVIDTDVILREITGAVPKASAMPVVEQGVHL